MKAFTFIILLFLAVMPMSLTPLDGSDGIFISNDICIEIDLSFSGNLMVSACQSGGPGATSCTISNSEGGCGVTCMPLTYYACCNAPDSCTCVDSTAPGEG
jgi:hypothetical protein